MYVKRHFCLKRNKGQKSIGQRKAGVIQPEYDTNYAQTQGEGKTETIKKLIAVNHDNQEPILIAGDSNGDYAMLKDFPKLQMGIIFNLLRDPSKESVFCKPRQKSLSFDL